jgi:hypothetical protein
MALPKFDSNTFRAAALSVAMAVTPAFTSIAHANDDGVSAQPVSMQRQEIKVPYKDMSGDKVEQTQTMAAIMSGKRDSQGKTGIVILYYGNNDIIRDEIRIGASAAKDDHGNPIQVRGMIVANGNSNDFEIYGSGGPITHRLGPENAIYLAKSGVEQVYDAIVKPDFFSMNTAPNPLPSR